LIGFAANGESLQAALKGIGVVVDLLFFCSRREQMCSDLELGDIGVGGVGVCVGVGVGVGV